MFIWTNMTGYNDSSSAVAARWHTLINFPRNFLVFARIDIQCNPRGRSYVKHMINCAYSTGLLRRHYRIIVTVATEIIHDDVVKWKHFPRYWPFVRGSHRSPVNFSHKGQWRGALMFSLICARINGCVNKREPGDLRRHRAHYDVTVML